MGTMDILTLKDEETEAREIKQFEQGLASGDSWVAMWLFLTGSNSNLKFSKNGKDIMITKEFTRL